jgi:hypothetical protein
VYDLGLLFFLHRYLVLMYYEAKNTFNNVWEGWFMKFYRAFALLIAIAAISSLMSMQKDKGRLNFVLNDDRSIRGYSQQNMNFFKKLDELAGKDIVDVIPLSEEDRTAVLLGFSRVDEKKETVKVSYSLEQQKFVATLTAVYVGPYDGYNYFVKVQEAKK